MMMSSESALLRRSAINNTSQVALVSAKAYPIESLDYEWFYNANLKTTTTTPNSDDFVPNDPASASPTKASGSSPPTASASTPGSSSSSRLLGRQLTHSPTRPL
ncbi:hypothetical protein Scep_004601 [Stephania cephalantha]|uniref:Uncharacterized protein n=1 Tax=Stephania cephalantha TaxID=152367 RepID=A0AAP0KUI1_9MAGN